ncbi:MAG: tRNA(5-methylaminomethyl-2-thiouridylate) methyltransferase [Desulfovibrio sp.]|nr:tRNA(5-methylaminomethyl-2-thiouridylate) methyltransferase [Desulfovibrio sp.]
MSVDAIVLFSGGLDSILAAKVLEEQGLEVLCLHCISPFFGSRHSIDRWKKIYSLNIVSLDVGREFMQMLCRWPAHGFGKVLNPCVDCKILLLTQAKKYMDKIGATFLATGEVLGQRPMSQRRDTLFLISREANVRDCLLRPLSAQHLPPTPMEENGLVNRDLLPAIAGRGRSEQLELATKFKLAEIPTPAGGCKLTEKENGRRYWQILKHYLPDCGVDKQEPPANGARIIKAHEDFRLSGIGRQMWQNDYWLCIGRNSCDNDALRANASKDDILIKLCDFSGPIALARHGASWPDDILESACAITSAYSPRAASSGGKVRLSLKLGDEYRIIEVFPERKNWHVPEWEETKEEIRRRAKEYEQITKLSRNEQRICKESG